jgi:hypothetical protein
MALNDDAVLAAIQLHAGDSPLTAKDVLDGLPDELISVKPNPRSMKPTRFRWCESPSIAWKPPVTLPKPRWGAGSATPAAHTSLSMVALTRSERISIVTASETPSCRTTRNTQPRACHRLRRLFRPVQPAAPRPRAQPRGESIIPIGTHRAPLRLNAVFDGQVGTSPSSSRHAWHGQVSGRCRAWVEAGATARWWRATAGTVGNRSRTPGGRVRSAVHRPKTSLPVQQTRRRGPSQARCRCTRCPRAPLCLQLRNSAHAPAIAGDAERASRSSPLRCPSAS